MCMEMAAAPGHDKPEWAQTLKAQSAADGSSGGDVVKPIHRRAGTLTNPSADASAKPMDEQPEAAHFGFGSDVRQPLQPLDNSTYQIEGAAARKPDDVARSITTAAASVQTDAELGAVLEKEDGLIAGYYEETGAEQDVMMMSQVGARTLQALVAAFVGVPIAAQIPESRATWTRQQSPVGHCIILLCSMLLALRMLCV